MILLTACLSACKNSERAEISIIEGYDNPMKENGEGVDYADFYIKKLDVPSDIYLGSVQKIACMEEYIILQTMDGVYCFDSEGKYIRQYGTKGHGPGEYVQVGGMLINHETKTVSLYDSFSCSMIRYASDGTYLGTESIPNDAFSLMFSADVLEDDRIFINYFLQNSQNTAFAVCDMQTFERTEVLSYGIKSQSTTERTGIHSYNIHDGRVECVLPFKNKVYCYNMQDSFPIYEIRTKKDILSEEELSDMNYYSTINFEYIENDDVFLGFNDIFETDSYLLFNTACNSYFLVDKLTMTGQRYSNYSFECAPLKYLPLLNISAMHDDYLIGIMDSEAMEQMEFDEKSDDTYLSVLEQYARNTEDGKIYLLYYKI